MKDNLFLARVDDLSKLSHRTSVPHFLGFLSEEEQAVAKQFLTSKHINHTFYGGYDGAQRSIMCCMPDWCDSPVFPITAVTFSYNNSFKLSHRDFLGALMSVGITRESVGDILTEDGRAVIFLKDKISNFVVTQIDKVGRVGVNISEGFKNPLPVMSELVECTVTVSSMRLDCVVSAVCNISRGCAVNFICNNSVLVNSLVTDKITKSLQEGDSLTVRGKGKFFITSASDRSKKGKIILNYSKYK